MMNSHLWTETPIARLKYDPITMEWESVLDERIRKVAEVF